MCDDFFDDFDGLDWEDWMIIGPLSEEIADEMKRRIYRDIFYDDYKDSETDWRNSMSSRSSCRL